LPNSSPLIASAFIEVFLVMLYRLPDGLENRGRNAAPDALGVNDQQPNLATCETGEIDHPDPAALSRAGSGPSHFPAPTAAGDYIACLRVRCNPRAERASLLLRPELVRVGSERGGFDDGLHSPHHTSLTDNWQSAIEAQASHRTFESKSGLAA